MPALSPDGKKLAFAGRRSGKWELWVKSLEDESETLLAADDFGRAEPRWSPDGTLLAYTRTKPGVPSSPFEYMLLRGGGDEELLMSDRDGTLYDWSTDGTSVLVTRIAGESELGGPGDVVWLLSISGAPHPEAQARLVTASREYGLYQLSFSPDGRWIAFEAVRRDGATNATLYVVPTSGGAWVRVTDGKSWDDKPRWSPDGRVMYFISSRTGFLNMWGIQFETVDGRPVGDPFRVTAFESPAQLVPSQTSLLGMSLTENRLVLPISEVSGSIWMLENVDR
jgi:Tol biopolymer transport system component